MQEIHSFYLAYVQETEQEEQDVSYYWLVCVLDMQEICSFELASVQYMKEMRGKLKICFWLVCTHDMQKVHSLFSAHV